MADLPTPAPANRFSRTRLRWEIVLVLCVTFGQSAVYSLITLLRRFLATVPLSQQSTQLNPQRDTVPVWDVIYNVLDVFFDLALVALVVYLLWEPGRNALRAIGLDFRRIGSDTVRGVVLVLAIGIPGIGLYLVGRSLGFTVAVQTSATDLTWWTVPTLLLSALRSGLMEEIVMIGWLFDRFRRIGVGPWATIVTSAVVRGLYHSYQGVGPIIGNFVMGLVFGWAYRRWGRVMPLVIAHTLIDAVAFRPRLTPA
ncbi:CPBP family intramembrane glutamic endopeptidase [Microbacterium gorillae]|uniref:CPBP family intramembrane glutamic endopeptidase n=1 Tax=Microbacterium gorillae TaxID=1231063 RepID=UPI000590E2EE|nr:CPBP family intramembrane glutamic endopeptidase [Microbacterium gorillae]